VDGISPLGSFLRAPRRVYRSSETSCLRDSLHKVRSGQFMPGPGPSTCPTPELQLRHW
jgi:hypothetical protein